MTAVYCLKQGVTQKKVLKKLYKGDCCGSSLNFLKSFPMFLFRCDVDLVGELEDRVFLCKYFLSKMYLGFIADIYKLQ